MFNSTKDQCVKKLNQIKDEKRAFLKEEDFSRYARFPRTIEFAMQLMDEKYQDTLIESMGKLEVEALKN